MIGSNNKFVLLFLSWGSFIIHYHVKAQNTENGFVHNQLQYIGMPLGGVDQREDHDYAQKAKKGVERVLWAPHLFKEGNEYVMFYNAGN